MILTTAKAKEQNITLEEILNKISEYEIYAHYLGQFKIGNIYNSPFRKDKNPSFGIFVSRKTHKLMFKDHGTGDSGDIIKFVGLLYNIVNYQEIISRIYKDLNVKSIKKHLQSTHVYDEITNTNIGVVKQQFNNLDIEYWKQFGISTDTLKRFNVSSIKYYLCNGVVKGIYSTENPMFAYQVYDKYKIYRPLGNKFSKWRNNLTNYDIQGFEQLPKKGELLIITKSLKDVMTLYELGFTAIATSSESTFIPKEPLDDILKRFKRVIILFDRDTCGVKQSRAESLKTGLEAMFVHKKYHAKDISDAVKAHGKDEIKKWLKQTINGKIYT